MNRMYLFGEINDEVAETFIRELHEFDSFLEPEDIVIVLCSPGGDESAGYAIYDAIMMCKCPVIIEGYGEVSSISSLIFQAADIRRLAPNSFFMVHSGQNVSWKEC